MSANNSYYYQLLNKQQQQTYFLMRQGLQELKTSFPVPRLSGKELSDIYFMVRMDHPELFYSVRFTYRYYPDSENVEFIPEYIFEKKKLKEHIQAMESPISKLTCPAQKMSELEKEVYIHDFICQNITYDKLKKAYSHEIIGALGHGVGVCEGIAKSVKALCDRLGIWCIIALSDNNPEKKIKYRHTWNIIKIDGKYYHLDVTFDNSLGSEDLVRYDYFNLNDKQIFRDHEPSIYPIPACTDGAHSYYQNKKLSLTKLEQVKSRASQAAKKNKTFVFHWRGGYLTKEVLKEILDIIQEEGEKKGKHPLVSLNWQQSVIRLSYVDDIPEQIVVMEEANEGELYDVEEEM